MNRFLYESGEMIVGSSFPSPIIPEDLTHDSSLLSHVYCLM